MKYINISIGDSQFYHYKNMEKNNNSPDFIEKQQKYLSFSQYYLCSFFLFCFYFLYLSNLAYFPPS